MARAGTSTARRYAEAAFEIAERDKNMETWLAQLDRLAAALTDDEVVRRLEDPETPVERRQVVFEALFSDGQMLPQVNNLVGLMLRRRRLEMVGAVDREFRRLYNRREGIHEAVATSAAKLDAQEVNALRSRLEQMTGGKVELTFNVDPQLLGGVQVRLGDLLIDGSVRGRLERLRNKLESGVLTP
ncbi:MAG TPA: F0F1 ATP synthase subunit delta [Candidatus Limnocylindrales bacterium]|jgi:F-type H+-transporting ATPase subunit delta